MIKFIERYRQKKGTDLLQKALSHKYIRRYPKKNGKGYNYVYTDSWKHPFKFLLSVFGLSKEKVVDSYEKNDIQKEYGADKKTWAGHILEYFTNRAKWDGFFSKKETRDGYKKPVKQSVVKAENEEKAKKVQTENKTKTVVNKDKMPINRSLMRKVWSLYSEQGKQVAKEENMKKIRADNENRLGADHPNESSKQSTDNINQDSQIVNESEAEAHQNRSEAMQGNENAKKDGIKVENDEYTRRKDFFRDSFKRNYPNKIDRQFALGVMAKQGGTKGKIARDLYEEEYGEAVKQRFDPKVERRRRIKAGEKSFNGLKDVLTTNKARTVVNEKLGKVYIEAGETGKSGYGLKHIIEQRYVKDGKTLDETTAICWLVADTVKNGTITRENGRTVEIQNGGIVAIVRKESDDKKAKWVLTGFTDSDNEKEATDSIKSVIDDYRYSVEFSSFRTQVGAVISSINNVEQENPKVNETPKTEVDTTTPVGKTSLGENIVNSISTDKSTKIPMAKVESIENGKVIFKATPQFKKCLKQLDSFKSKDEAKKLMTYVSIADGNLYSTDGRTVMRVKLDGAEDLFGAYTYTVDNDKVVFSKVDGINELLPYERVIPNYNGEKTATINNKALLEKISSMRKEGALGDKKYQKMALEFKNGKCFVDGVEVGNAPNMENGFVCYHAKYLERALKNSDTSILNFSDLKDGLKRAVSISTNVSDIVIMPMNDDGVVPDYEANRAEYGKKNNGDEHNNRSEAMKGNQNAKKPFSEMSQEEKTEKAEQIKNNVVASVKADSVPYNNDGKYGDSAREWIKNNPQGDANTVIGKVLINEKSAINDLHHGSKEDMYLKLQTLPAVKNILENGTYLGFEKDFGGKNIDNHYFAGKVKYGNEEKIVFCRVRETRGLDSRFYVHEVFTEDELKNMASQVPVTNVGLPQLTGKPLFKYILQDVLNVKEDKNEDTSELEKIKNWKAPENLGELVNDKNFQCHFHNNFLRVSSLVGNDFGKVYTNIERFSSFSKEDKAKVGLYAIGLGYKFDDMENSFKYKGRYYLVVKGEGDRYINGMSYPNSDKIVCLNDLYDIQQLKEKVEKLSEKGFSRNDVVTKIQDAEEGIRLTEKTIARYKKAGFDYSNEEKELEEYKNALKDWKDISKRMYLVEQAEQGIYPTHSEESEEQNTKNDNLSEAMKGNQNAKKEFTQADKEAVLKTLNNPTEKMLKVEYTRDNYNKLFPMGEVDTPIGKVKLGEHQFERLGEKDGGARKQFLGLLSQTLKNPDVIIDEVDNQNRNAKVWIKTVVDEDRAFRKRYYVAITPTIDGLDVVVSNGEREHKQIEDKIKMASIYYYQKIGGGSPTARTELNSLPSSYDNTPKAENVNNNADVVTPKFEIDKDKVSQINDISMSGKQGNSYQHDLDVSIEDFKKQFDVSKMNERQKEYFQERLNDYGKFAYESYNDMANKRIKAGPSWAVAGRGNYNSKHFDTGMDAEMNAFKTYRERQEKFIKNTKNHLDELRYDSNSESLETEKQKVFNDYASGKRSDSAIENTDPFAIEKISGHIKFLEDAHAVTLALYKKIKQNGTSMFELEYQDKNKDLKEKIYKELREEFKVKGMSIGAIKDGINHPFTSNQTANIRRYKERLEQLKKRQQVIDERKGKGSESSSNTGKVNFKGGYVYENPEIDRIQIFYDGIPSAEVRSKLKSNGFRWSPSQKAWQRQLNRNGRYAVNRVFKETGIDVELDTINGGVEVKKSLPAFAFKGNKFLIRKSVLKAFCV